MSYPVINEQLEQLNHLLSHQNAAIDLLASDKRAAMATNIADIAMLCKNGEIMELMDITFEGLDTSKRLFMPDSMLDGQGQILVTPMNELIEKTHKKEGE